MNQTKTILQVPLDEKQRLELEQSAKKQGLSPEQFLVALYRMWQDYEWENDA